jgi:RHS repeat-associated protein
MLSRGHVFGLIGIILLSIFLSIGIFAVGSVQVPGYLPGSFSVNELNGAAEYTIPINTPAGIKGIEPHLSLKYSSRAGNGLLGVGWSLTGIPVITRRPTVAMRDGITHSVDYSANDRFALDGKTLLCVSGTYGSDGAIYRTERDEFAKIISYGTAGAGPSYFKVWTKDGHIMEFGNTADSKVLAGAGPNVDVWAMNKLSDLCGNYLTVSYYDDGYTNFLQYCNWGFRINSINYAYTPTAQCSVVFNYETRNDYAFSYANTSRHEMDYRMNGITTYVGTQSILTYQLGYEYGGAAQKSRLINVTAFDAAGNNLPPTTITYKTNTPGYQKQVWGNTSYNLSNAQTGDFTGNGQADLIFRVDEGGVTHTYVLVSTGNNTFSAPQLWATDNFLGRTQNKDFFIGDFNGDGLSDMMVIDNSSNAWVYLSNGHGFTGPYQWSTDGKMLQNPSSSNMATRIGDFNGDGLTDIISVDTVHKTTGIWISTGSSFTYCPNWFSGDNPGNYYQFDLGDFNGDGMTDVIVISKSPEVWFSTGTGFQYRPEYNQPFATLANVSGWEIFNNIMGDGYSSLYCYDMFGNMGMYFSAGNGFFEVSSNTENPLLPIHGYDTVNGIPYGLNFNMGDLNGDGSPDVINNYCLSSSIGGNIWTGHSYQYYPLVNSNNSGTIENIPIQPDDFTGCGRSQVCIQRGTEIDVYVPNDSSKEDVISSITDGLGKQITIAYKPLTDSTVYQKNNHALYPAIRDYQGPIYVVSNYSISNGLGGANVTNNYSYTYAGACIDTFRRELLGFQSAALYDAQTGLTTTSTYLQGFPFSGLLASRTSTDCNGKTIDSIANTYSVQCYDSGTLNPNVTTSDQWFMYDGTIPVLSSRSYFPYLTKSLKDDYFLTGSTNPVTVTEEDYTYLDYGDLQQKVTSISTIVGNTGGSTTYDGFQETDSYQYLSNDYTNWIIGLVSQQTNQGKNNQGITATRTTSFAYDTAHRLLTTENIEPSGDKTVKLTRTYAYTDSYYNLTKITETGYNGSATENRVTSFSYAYSTNEFHITKTNPAGLVEIYDYEWQNGKQATYTDPNGLMTDWYYDTFGRLSEEVRPDSTQTTYTYSSGGPVSGAVYSLQVQETGLNNNQRVPMSPPVTTSFDMLDREIYQQSQDPAGQTIFKTTVYNNLGLVGTKSRYYYSGGNPQNTSFIYDSLGRVSSQNAYNSGTSTYAYNANGCNNISVTNALNQNTLQTFNAMGKLYGVLDSLSKMTTYTYTPFGDLQQVTDSLNNTTTLSYDIRGRRTQVVDPDMGTWIYTSNAFGDLVSQTDANGNTVNLTYDKLSRILTKSQIYTWTYDTATNGKGKPAKVTGPGYQETYTYDSLSRLQNVSTNVAGTTYSVTYGYDTLGRMNQIIYPACTDLTVNYDYTTNGYLQSLSGLNSNSPPPIVFWTANTRNALGQVTQETLYQGFYGTTTNRTFDPTTGRLTAINTGSGIQSLSYTYDTIGNLLSRNDSLKNLTENFSYDNLNRLTGVTGPQNKTYSYNEIGNILTKSDVGTYTYGSTRPHAVTSAGGVNYTYDNNGNIVSDTSGRSIGYDAFNRPTQLTKTGTNAANGTLTYDAYDKLLKQVVTQGSTTTTTIYIGDLCEIVTTGSVSNCKCYIIAEGRKVALYGGGLFYLYKDHLGSMNVTVENGSVVVDSLSYDPFGMRRNAATWTDQSGITCTTTDIGYTGHIQLDVFSLVHMGSRIYDPKLGRFISPDKLIQKTKNLQFNDPQLLNIYSYCINNPLKYIDPKGESILNPIRPRRINTLGCIPGQPGYNPHLIPTTAVINVSPGSQPASTGDEWSSGATVTTATTNSNGSVTIQTQTIPGSINGITTTSYTITAPPNNLSVTYVITDSGEVELDLSEVYAQGVNGQKIIRVALASVDIIEGVGLVIGGVTIPIGATISAGAPGLATIVITPGFFAAGGIKIYSGGQELGELTGLDELAQVLQEAQQFQFSY